MNSDGATPLKEQLCKELGIEYMVSKRLPHGNLPVRSTTMLRKECRIPYRIDLAGGWLDQPFVSSCCAGPVLTISIEPEYEFNDRSGMSTSSRKKRLNCGRPIYPRAIGRSWQRRFSVLRILPERNMSAALRIHWVSSCPV